jgi:hypothetical protein
MSIASGTEWACRTKFSGVSRKTFLMRSSIKPSTLPPSVYAVSTDMGLTFLIGTDSGSRFGDGTVDWDGQNAVVGSHDLHSVNSLARLVMISEKRHHHVCGFCEPPRSILVPGRQLL